MLRWEGWLPPEVLIDTQVSMIFPPLSRLVAIGRIVPTVRNYIKMGEVFTLISGSRDRPPGNPFDEHLIWR